MGGLTCMYPGCMIFGGEAEGVVSSAVKRLHTTPFLLLAWPGSCNGHLFYGPYQRVGGRSVWFLEVDR